MTDPAPLPPLWDCHVHVIGDRARWPLAASRSYDPPDAPPAALAAHLARIGARHAVIVQPSVYGFDNRCLLDALAGSGGQWRGVVVPAPDTAPSELARMHAVGVRGIRCNRLNTGGLALEACAPWWSFMQDHGWHLQLQIDAGTADLDALLDSIPVPVVIDHMGFPAGGPDDPGLDRLVAAVGEGRVFVKLSAPYRISRQPVPHADARRLAARFLAADPSRCLWASDWPHTDFTAPLIPDEDWLSSVAHDAGPDWATVRAAAEGLYRA